MNRLIIAVAVVFILAVGAIAYAHGPGYDGWGGGHMKGYVYGGHMMGPGYGRHMMAREGAGYEDNQKFLDETRDLRKDLHSKRFEYMELSRNSDTSEEALSKLDKEIIELEDKIREKAPRTAMGRAGYGYCW
ncbi:MAG: hypothetical protein JSW20_06630 [Nitrospiraceae bacterium]|nr:MAG: hypothetical protein JSW20_06630 [Nitrospiraceae bacterium]